MKTMNRIDAIEMAIQFAHSPVFRHYCQKAVNTWAGKKVELNFISSNGARTNGEKIWVGPTADFPEDMMDLNEMIRYITRDVFGKCAHELGHIWWTDFIAMEPLTHQISNIIEDAAVDRGLGYCSWPGLGRYVQWLRNESYKNIDLMPESTPKLQAAINLLIQKVIFGRSKDAPNKFFADEDLIVFEQALSICLNGRIQPLPKSRIQCAREAAELLKRFVSSESGDTSSDYKEKSVVPRSLDEKAEPIPMGDARDPSETGLEPTGLEAEKDVSKAESKNFTKDSSDSEGSEGGVCSKDRAETRDEKADTDVVDDFIDSLIASVEAETKRRKEVYPSPPKDTAWGDEHKGVTHIIDHVSTCDSFLYRNIVSQYTGLIAKSTADIKAAIRQQRDEWTTVKQGSQIDLRQLSSGRRSEVFKKPLAFTDEPDFSFTLLVDLSASMHSDNKIAFAKDATIVISEILYKAKIPFAILGHNAQYGKDVVGLKIYKGFRENLPSDTWGIALAQIEHGFSGNRDGYALRWTGEYINTNSPSQNNIVLVLSDGLPYHDGTEYVHKTKDVQDQGAYIQRQYGINVFGIGYMESGIEAVSKCYRNTLAVDSVKKLLPLLVNKIKEFYPEQE